MKQKKKKNVLSISVMFAIGFIILIFMVVYVIKNIKKSEKTLESKYAGKNITAEEVTDNMKEDAKLEELVRQLIVNNDMMCEELGIYPYDEIDTENQTEINDEERNNSSERYYRERAEIIMQIKELMKEKN